VLCRVFPLIQPEFQVAASVIWHGFARINPVVSCLLVRKNKPAYWQVGFHYKCFGVNSWVWVWSRRRAIGGPDAFIVRCRTAIRWAAYSPNGRGCVDFLRCGSLRRALVTVVTTAQSASKEIP